MGERERERKRENTAGENREIVRRMRGGLQKMNLRRKKKETREDARWGKKRKRRRDTEDTESTG